MVADDEEEKSKGETGFGDLLPLPRAEEGEGETGGNVAKGGG